MIICNQCGAAIKDAARFCKECGAAVPGAHGTARQTTPPTHFVAGEPPAPRHRPSSTLPFIFGGGLVAVLLLLVGLSANRSDEHAAAVGHNSSYNTNTVNSSVNSASNNTYANAGGQMNRGQMNTSATPAANKSTAGKWVVILSGNASFAKAQEFAEKISAYRPTMYLREGLYRTTVGPYRTKDLAMRARDRFRVEIIGDAYIENMDTWCRNPEPSGGILACK